VEQGVAQEDFNKIIEYMNKNYTQNLRENSYWLSVINSRFLIGKDMHTTYKTALDAVTPQKLHEFIKQMVDTDNRLEVIMNGVAPESK
jgi:zinc protease